MLLPRALPISLAALCAFTACGDKDDPEPTDSEEEEDDSATEDSTISDSEDSEDSALADNDGDGALADEDCDDDDATVYPGAPETCDGRDEDCDGSVDEDAGEERYHDADGDGYGDLSAVRRDCVASEGWVLNSADCDDTSADISPDAKEVCDSLDNDCDGQVDAGVRATAAHRSVFDANVQLTGTSSVNYSFGLSLLSLGDIDGDGGAEIIITEDRRLHLYRSSGPLWTSAGEVDASIAEMTLSEEPLNIGFGTTVHRVADIDGDGRPDLAVSAPDLKISDGGFGAVYLFFSGGALSSASGELLHSDADLVIYSALPSAKFGHMISSGDFDGDGLSDLVIGDPSASTTTLRDAGVTYVFLSGGALATGATRLTNHDADIAFFGEQAGDGAGQGVIVPGDLDGDGLDDLAISSAKSSAGASGAGMLYILRSSGALATSSAWTSLGVSDMRAWGGGVTPHRLFVAGDLDGDGLAELAIGTTQTDDYRKFDPALVGRVSFLFSGGALSVGAGDLDLSTVDLTILGEPDGDYFGEQMMSGGDLDGDGRDDLVFTAPRDTRGGLESGAVFVMTTLGSLDLSQEQLWAEDADLVISSHGQYLGAGLQAAIIEDQDADGLDELLVSLPKYNTNGKVEGMAALIRGSTVSDALLFDCEGGAMSLADAAFTATEDDEDALTGYAVAILGDLDGDGLGELVIGSPGADAETDDGGEVRVLLSGGAMGGWATSGSPEELALDTADITIRGLARGGELGARLVAAEDIEGDGLPDLLVFEPEGNLLDDTGVGVAYLFTSSGALASGVSSLTTDDADVVFAGVEDGITSIGDAGDVDGDGLTDLLFGAIDTWSRGESGGRAYLFLSGGALADGSPSYNLDDADRWFKGEKPGDYAGGVVTGVGDVDGDGLGDLVITAAPRPDAMAYLLLSSGALGGTESAVELYDADAFLAVTDMGGPSFGGGDTFKAAPAGDLDGDGLSDLALSITAAFVYGSDSGAVYLFTTTGALRGVSGGTLTEEDADLTLLGTTPGAYVGHSVVSAPDMDGDGASELIITAPWASLGAERTGEVYVLRSGGALSTSGDTIDLAEADLTLYGAAMFDNAGASVSAAGDVDGDGLSDLLIGAPADSGFNDRFGAAMLITSGQLIEHARP